LLDAEVLARSQSVVAVTAVVLRRLARHDNAEHVVGCKFAKRADKSAIFAAAVAVNNAFCARLGKDFFYPFHTVLN
jgi:hypothetical protein